MASAVPVPYHTLEESPNSRTIKIGDWEITARTNPISNAGELDTLQAAVGGFPLPEMTFGNNDLELVHKPTGWRYGFSTEDALKGVKNGELEPGDGGVKVGHADAWLKSRYVASFREPKPRYSRRHRTGPSSQLPMPKTVPTKVYDWTYTTTYGGHVLPESSSTPEWKPVDPENENYAIPLAELTRHDPILFYAEIPLYEDELHDNGSSHLLVRIVSTQIEVRDAQWP